MGDTARILTFEDRLDLDIYCALYEIPNPNGSTLVEQTPGPSDSLALRRKNIEIGCDFTIISGRDVVVCWRLPVRNAAMSGVLLSKSLRHAIPQLGAHIPAQFDPLVIDIMVSFLEDDWNQYTQPMQLRHARGATELNKHLASLIDTTVPVLIYLSVFDIAIVMDIPELATHAIDTILNCLTQDSDHIFIEHFEKLVAWGWNKSDNDVGVDVHGKICSLRRMVAIYGTTMEYIFYNENPKLWYQLIYPNEKYPEYARWHFQAGRLLNTVSESELEPYVQTFKDKAKKLAKPVKDAENAENAEGSENVEGSGDSQGAEDVESTVSEN